MLRAIWILGAGVGLVLIGMNGCQSSGTANSVAADFETFSEQVAYGGRVYGANCAECHGNAGQGTMEAPRLVGQGALPLRPRRGSDRSTDFRNAMDIAVFVTQNMPPNKDERAEMAARDYWAVLAFALSANGVEREAPVTPANAESIVLHP